MDLYESYVCTIWYICIPFRDFSLLVVRYNIQKAIFFYSFTGQNITLQSYLFQCAKYATLFFLYLPVAQYKDLFKQKTLRTRDTHSTINDITHWFWCIFTQWRRHFINLRSHLLTATNCLLVMVCHFTGLNDQRKHSAPTHLEANCIKMQHSLTVTFFTLNHN